MQPWALIDWLFTRECTRVTSHQSRHLVLWKNRSRCSKVEKHGICPQETLLQGAAGLGRWQDLSYATASHAVPSLNLGGRILGARGFRRTNLGGPFDRSLPGSPDRISGQLPGHGLRYILPVTPGPPKRPPQSCLNTAATLQISASASRGLLSCGIWGALPSSFKDTVIALGPTLVQSGLILT